MKLSEELAWRGFVNQTTYKDVTAIDGGPITFYWGVDPSADSMTIGNLAAAMMVRHFIDHGHKAVLLVGGATGLIGDPDGKSQERELQSLETIAKNKAGLSAEYERIFAGSNFEIVDNYDWFKEMGYLQFLRDVGKHVPMRTMLGRDFVSSRLGEDGAGISYAEFSYSLIQGYDFVHLNREKDVTLQLCGADQWGNSIAGVDLVRRLAGNEVHVWSTPLVINKATGLKFGKTESGAVWLDPAKTSPTQFYQFWINSDDGGVADYMKIYTLLDKAEIDTIMQQQASEPGRRTAQKRLAAEVTTLVHGADSSRTAAAVTDILTGSANLDNIDEETLRALKNELPYQVAKPSDSIGEILVRTGLAASLSDARRLLGSNGVSINGTKVKAATFADTGITGSRLLLRRGKAFKDSAIIEFE